MTSRCILWSSRSWRRGGSDLGRPCVLPRVGDVHRKFGCPAIGRHHSEEEGIAVGVCGFDDRFPDRELLLAFRAWGVPRNRSIILFAPRWVSYYTDLSVGYIPDSDVPPSQEPGQTDLNFLSSDDSSGRTWILGFSGRCWREPGI